jgi:parvulin-like peptidyl-prolyl isomerase
LKRITTCAAAFLLCAASLAGCGGDKQKVAVRVNKETITEEAFNQRVRNVNVANLQQSMQGGNTPRAGEYAIKNLVYETLFMQMAADEKAIPTDAQVNAYVPFAKRWQQQPLLTFMDYDPFRTDADWKRDCKVALARRTLVMKPLKLTEAEIKDLYEKLKPQITPPDQYHLRVVDVKDPAKAQKALETLKKGVAFETVALTQSEDPQSRGQNGDIGTMPANGLPPPFVAAVKNLKPGQYAPQVIPTQAPKRGAEVQPGTQPPMETRYFLLQLVEKIPGKVPTLEEARMVAEGFLLQQKDRSALMRLQEKLTDYRKKADIQINIPEYKDILKDDTTPAPGPAGCGASGCAYTPENCSGCPPSCGSRCASPAAA